METLAFYIEIFMLSWNLRNGRKHQGITFKIWLSPRVIDYLKMILMLFWMK